jgi:hypothetical protein
LKSFHIEKTFDNFSDLILLRVIVFNGFSHHVDSEEGNLCDEDPDADGRLFVGFGEGDIFVQFIIIYKTFICTKSDNVMCNSIDIDLIGSEFASLWRSTSIITISSCICCTIVISLIFLGIFIV